jgi:hypothetical protein
MQKKFCHVKNYVHLCKVIKNEKQMETLEQLLDSKEFNEMFDFETEKKEIEESGWTYEEIKKFAESVK